MTSDVVLKVFVPQILKTTKYVSKRTRIADLTFKQTSILMDNEGIS